MTRDRHSDPTLVDQAVGLPWLAWDSEEARNVIAVDVDHPDGSARAAEIAALGLPQPTLILDPWSGRSHAVWRLTTPVLTTLQARQGPRLLADLAGRLLAAAMGGTLLPQRSLVKSPWGRADALVGERLRRGAVPTVPAVWDAYEAARTGLLWHTEAGELRGLELRDVIAALGDELGRDVTAAPRRMRCRGEPDGRGRNCSLFDQVRWWSYDRHETDERAIRAEADRVSAAMADPLPPAELAAISRSIARFMSTRYRPRSASEGAGRDHVAGADLAPKERQALAGRRTSEDKVQETDQRIAAAMDRLSRAGTPLTQAAIAVASGLGVRTVRRRWNRPSASLSGSAAGARPPAEPTSFQNPSSSSPSTLADVARRDRTIRKTVVDLSEIAGRVRRPGVPSSSFPPIPTEIAHDPAVRAARRTAEVAIADADRRSYARMMRAEAAARRLDAESRLRADPREAWAWWRQCVADLDETWDALESNALDAADLAGIRERRQAVIGGRWRSWQAAVRAVQRGRDVPSR